jgi:hypothetical protein
MTRICPAMALGIGLERKFVFWSVDIGVIMVEIPANNDRKVKTGKVKTAK